MKITDASVIKNGEQELIEGIIADLDWGVIDEVIKEKHGLELEEDVEFRNGDLVVVENKVAYKLDFQVKLNISVLLDRGGNYIALETKKKKVEQSKAPDEPVENSSGPEGVSSQSLSQGPEEGAMPTPNP